MKNEIIEEHKALEKFEELHDKFVTNQVNKIQRYIANNLGLKPIGGKKPISKSKVREFVTQRLIKGKLQYVIKLSYGTKTVALVPTGSKEFDEETIISSLTEVYHGLYNGEFEKDYWNYYAAHPEAAKRELLGMKTSNRVTRFDKDVIRVIEERKFGKSKQLSFQGA